MKFYFFLIINILLLVLAIIIGSQNGHITEFNYLIAKSNITVAALAGISLLIGAFLASLVWFTYSLKLKFKLDTQKRKMVRDLSKSE